jgi:predicted RNA binding protein YcfA (HicA-like mRNA interferase family)
MPKLPVLSGADVIKALEQLGFAQVRQRGSTGTVVPLHREVKMGTLAGILRQAGVTQDEFLGAVK